jgi:hypothetical protein
VVREYPESARGIDVINLIERTTAMRIIRFKHLPSEQTFLVDSARGHVYGTTSNATSITLRDQIVRGTLGDVRIDDLLATAKDFERVWKWPAPGTRFPPAQTSGEAFPDVWFDALEGRLNQIGPLGDLEFRSFLDRQEENRLAAGADVAVERTALERHLSALDYQLKGKLDLFDLYKAFIANRLRPVAALKKALGALIVFGRGRAVDIASIAERRPAARTGAFDANGNVDPDILAQYRRLFDTTAADEIDQTHLERFNALNFQGGLVASEQWRTFFATCTALNHRETVTFKQLAGLFDGSFEYIAASRAGADGRRPLDTVMPDSTAL